MRKHVIAGVMVVILGIMLSVVPASAEERDGYGVLKGGYFSPSSGGFQNKNMNGNTYWELVGGVGAYYFIGNSRPGQWSNSTLAWGYPGGAGIDFRLGPLILGVESKYMGVDASLKMGDVKMEGVVTTGNIGFRF